MDNNKLEKKVEMFMTDLGQAMVERDIKVLDELLDDDACLQHITGYIQPKAEWLAQVKVDYFTYRKVEYQNIQIMDINNQGLISIKVDWTITGNSVWPFAAIFYLKEVDGKLKWQGTNKLSYR
ncbi:MAG: nuclear transport factor 2 family protein [Mycoplasmatales bacterium]